MYRPANASSRPLRPLCWPCGWRGPSAVASRSLDDSNRVTRQAQLGVFCVKLPYRASITLARAGCGACPRRTPARLRPLRITRRSKASAGGPPRHPGARGTRRAAPRPHGRPPRTSKPMAGKSVRPPIASRAGSARPWPAAVTSDGPCNNGDTMAVVPGGLSNVEGDSAIHAILH